MRWTAALLAVTAALGLAACEDREDDLFVVDEPLRFEAVEMIFDNQIGERVDLIDQGARFVLVLDEEAGTFESSFQFEQIDLDVAGTFLFDGAELVFSDDPLEADDRVISRRFAFDRVGQVLFIEDPESVFDVDGDGTAEVAALEIRLEER